MSDINRARLGNWRPKPVNVTTAGFPYVLLAVLAVTSIKVGTVGLDSHYVTIMLSALAALWMLFMHTLPSTKRRAALYPVFVAGLIAITAVLVVRSSWFGFFTTVCGSYMLRLPRLRPQFVAGSAVALHRGALADGRLAGPPADPSHFVRSPPSPSTCSSSGASCGSCGSANNNSRGIASHSPSSAR